MESAILKRSVKKDLGPQFTFIISTYNRATLLKRAVNSILNQTNQDFEVIISDDFSNDGTRDLVSGLGDPRVVYLCNRKNSGLSATRNAAIKHVRGKYVVFMDDDAVLQNNFLEILNRVISLYKINVFCPKILEIDTKKAFREFSFSSNKRFLGYFDFNRFRGGAHIIKGETLKINGYYDERFGVGSRYHAAEESDYFFRLKQRDEKILYCPELEVYHSREKDAPAHKVFNYSYGIAAMLTKNLISDFSHWPIYLFIILYRISISLLRSIQSVLFPGSIEAKNTEYRYKDFFKGTLAGIFAYVRFR